MAKLKLHDLEHTGRVVGGLSAWATAGALVGTFGTGFVLVPLMPTSTAVFATGGAAAGRRARAGRPLRRSRAHDRRGLPGGRPSRSAALALAIGSPCDTESDYHCAVVAGRPRARGRADARPRRPAPFLRRPRRPRPPRVRLHALDRRRDRRAARRRPRRRLPRRRRLHAAALRRHDAAGLARARPRGRRRARRRSRGGDWGCAPARPARPRRRRARDAARRADRLGRRDRRRRLRGAHAALASGHRGVRPRDPARAAPRRAVRAEPHRPGRARSSCAPRRRPCSTRSPTCASSPASPAAGCSAATSSSWPPTGRWRPPCTRRRAARARSVSAGLERIAGDAEVLRDDDAPADQLIGSG